MSEAARAPPPARGGRGGSVGGVQVPRRGHGDAAGAVSAGRRPRRGAPPLSIADEGRVAPLEKEMEAQRHYASRLEAALSEATDSMAGGAAIGQAPTCAAAAAARRRAANLDVNVSEGDDGFSVSVDAPAFSASPTRRPSGDACEKLQRQVGGGARGARGGRGVAGRRGGAPSSLSSTLDAAADAGGGDARG